MMFTGIIEEVGQVKALEKTDQHNTLIVGCTKVLSGSRIGDSIAVNGACLTITAINPDSLHFGLGTETLARTTFGCAPPQSVNLERALPADGRFGGHFVQGHIDGVGTLHACEAQGDSLYLTITAQSTLMRYITAKGYIAIDGISLTVIDALTDRFTLMLVHYTRHHVALSGLPLGTPVNIELDVLAKYIERLAAQR